MQNIQALGQPLATISLSPDESPEHSLWLTNPVPLQHWAGFRLPPSRRPPPTIRIAWLRGVCPFDTLGRLGGLSGPMTEQIQYWNGIGAGFTLAVAEE